MMKLYARFKKLWDQVMSYSDRFEDWRAQNKGKTRLIIAGTWLAITVIVLYYGMFIHPQYSHTADAKLNTYQTWDNSQSSVALIGKTYNAKKQTMVLRLSVKNSGTNVQTNALSNKIKFKVNVASPSTAAFETVPTTTTVNGDSSTSNYVMVIKQLKPNFKAIQVKAINNTVTSSTVADDPSLQLSNKQINFAKNLVDEGDATQAAEDAGYSKNTAAQTGRSLAKKKAVKDYMTQYKNNTVAFVVNYRPKIVDNNLKILSRTQYAFEDIKLANQKLADKNTTDKKEISTLQTAIQTDQQQIDNLKKNQSYLEASDQQKVTDQITNYNSDISTVTDQIKTLQKRISRNNDQIALNKKEKRDIESGHYKLPSTSISVQKFASK